MKILVPIKRCLDYKVKVRVKLDETGVDLANLKMSINPFDEIALEEALKLREAGHATEVIAVSIGDDKAKEILIHAYAMGVDRSILVKSEVNSTLGIAQILADVAKEEAVGIILCGKQAIDGDSSQVPQMIAGILDIPQATFASKITKSGDNFIVEREVDKGIEELEISTPCVISSDLRLNTPRFIKLPDIMKARSKKIEEKVVDGGATVIKTIKVSEPPKRQSGRKVANTAELVAELKKLGLV
jgi:electron transfer flavoprotein beta subunit